MKIIDSKITKEDLIKEHLGYFKTMVKAVVDVEKGIIGIDAELHADIEADLLEKGSKQEKLWGINLYPLKDRGNFIEYTALINIRPHQDNASMEIESREIKEKINKIIDQWIAYES